MFALGTHIRLLYAAHTFYSEVLSLADPGGAHGAPPDGRGPTIFMPKTLIFSIFLPLASLALNFKHNFNKNMAKTH